MNIAKIMIPKAGTAHLYVGNTVRQGLEVMKRHGYTAIPVLSEAGDYVGCVTEGDFLRHLLAENTTDLREHEKFPIMSILRRDFCPALEITASLREVLAAVLRQNFVPIVDARRCFCGIITRSAVIEYLIENGCISDGDE